MSGRLVTTTRSTTTTIIPVGVRYSTNLKLFETFCPATYEIDKYATVTWYAIGLITNVVAYRAWTGTSLRKGNSTAVYLAALAMSNLLFFLLHMVQELQYTWDVSTLNFPVVCELYYVALNVFKYLSPMFVFAAIVERWIAVCHPLSKANTLKRGRAKTVVFFLYVLSTGVNSVRGYYWKYEYGYVRKCVERFPLRNAVTGAFSTYWYYITVTEVFIFGFIPLVTIFMAIGIIRAMKRSNYKMLKSSLFHGSPSLSFHSQMHSPIPVPLPTAGYYDDGMNPPYPYYKHGGYPGYGFRPRRRPSKNANTSMLLTVAFYASITCVLWAIVFGMEALAPRGVERMTDAMIETDANWQSHFTYLAIRKVLEELLLSHYAVTFFLSLTGHRFRQAVLRMFACSCEDSARYVVDDGDRLRAQEPGQGQDSSLIAGIGALSGGGAFTNGAIGGDDAAAEYPPASPSPANASSPTARATYV